MHNAQNATIPGIPTTKYQCLVLWRKKYIPAHAPRHPPSNPLPKSIFSGIRHARCFALLLSIPMSKKPHRFIRLRYITSTLMAFSQDAASSYTTMRLQYIQSKMHHKSIPPSTEYKILEYLACQIQTAQIP